jgi:hypothetical protein
VCLLRTCVSVWTRTVAHGVTNLSIPHIEYQFWYCEQPHIEYQFWYCEQFEELNVDDLYVSLIYVDCQL